MKNLPLMPIAVLIALGWLGLISGCGSRSETKVAKPDGSAGDSVEVSVADSVADSTADAEPMVRQREAFAGHQRMLDRLAEIRDQTPKDNPFFGTARLEQLRTSMAELGADADLGKRGLMTLQLASQELNHGYIENAISLLQSAIKMADDMGGAKADLNAWSELHFRLGFAWLRLAETKNCCNRRSAESCILPIQGDGIHVEQYESRMAIVHFRNVLDARDKRRFASKRDLERHMKCQWLLNIAYMTIGSYPKSVPSKHLLKPQLLKSGVKLPRFKNIAPQLKLDTFNLAGGMVVDDFDNDGDFDMITSSFDTSESLRYFENLGDGTFQERSDRAGFTGLFGGLNMVQADYDNDGDLDVLVLRGGWFRENGQHPNSLLQNDGRGQFLDVTFAAGLADVNYPTQTADFADFDNDGDLDLYIGNEWSQKLHAPCQLFRNRGDGTFDEIAAEAGVTNLRMAKGVAWGDFNHDRWPDLAVSNRDQPNRLYLNKRDGTFQDIAVTANVTGPNESFPLWFWDYNNDGNLDLFISSYAAGMADALAHYKRLPSRIEPPGHFRGDGKGGFINVAKQQKLDYPMLPMGSNFGDLNNDGFLDVYLGTGEPDIATVLPNVLFMNQQGIRFRDATMVSGFGHLQKGHAVCFADFDQDGDVDVFEQMGGAWPVDKYADALYENPGLGGHWIDVRLVGKESNWFGIGARIHIRVMDQDGTERSIYRHVNSGGSFGANPLRQHIGLGKATKIVHFEIFWPTTGKTQVVAELPSLDSRVIIPEG